MSSVHIANPGIGGFGAGSAADRYAGVNLVRSDGTVAARHEAALLVAQSYTDVPSHVLSFNVAATAALDVFTLTPVANKVVRLRRIVLVNPGNATGAIVVDLQLGVASAAGSGGSAVQPQAVDPSPRVGGVSGGPDVALPTMRSGDTTLATGFVAVYNPLVSVSIPAAAAGFTPLVIYDARDPQFKPLTNANGGGAIPYLVLRTPAIGAGATGLRGYAEFTVDDA